MSSNPATAGTINRGIGLALAVAVLATLEQIFFGRDTPGTAHDISVAAFLISLVAALAFVGLLGARLVHGVRQRRSSLS